MILNTVLISKPRTANTTMLWLRPIRGYSPKPRKLLSYIRIAKASKLNTQYKNVQKWNTKQISSNIKLYQNSLAAQPSTNKIETYVMNW